MFIADTNEDPKTDAGAQPLPRPQWMAATLAPATNGDRVLTIGVGSDLGERLNAAFQAALAPRPEPKLIDVAAVSSDPER